MPNLVQLREQLKNFSSTVVENSTWVGNEVAPKTTHGWTWSPIDFKTLTDGKSLLCGWEISSRRCCSPSG